LINEINNDQLNVINYITKALEFNSNHIECLSILANYYFYQYNFKKAVIYFRKIHDLIQNEEISKADNLCSIAICLLSIGEIKSSITLFLKSLEIIKEFKSKNDTTDEELSITFLSEEIKILQGKIYNNLGNAYRKVNDFDNALKFYLMSLNSENIFTHQICCFNLGTMLISKGDFLAGINYLEKAINHQNQKKKESNYLLTNSSENLNIEKYINSKGLNYFFSHSDIKEAISLYCKGKYNNSILKLKSIYKEHGENPIVNFFLGYNYLSLLKYEKSTCFFNKLNLLSQKYSYEKFSFLNKLCVKANLILKKIPSLDIIWLKCL
jgi:TPR repeat protein